MRPHVLAPVAEADIREIADYIAADNVDAAMRLVDDLYDAFARLAEFPDLGHYRPDSRIGPCVSGQYGSGIL